MLLKIRDWEHHFENNRTRELKSLGWVPLPNRQDGDGYTELLDHKDGASHYGAWVAIVQVASRCDPRGTLLRDGRTSLHCSKIAHDSASLSRMTRIPKHILQAAIERLISIGWLEAVETETDAAKEDNIESQGDATIPHLPAVAPQDVALNGRERKKGKEQKEEVVFPDELNSEEFKTAWENYIAYRKERGLSKLQSRSIEQQFSEMAGWGRAKAIASINQTIRNGWQGIFEHGTTRANHQKPSDPTRVHADGESPYTANLV